MAAKTKARKKKALQGQYRSELKKGLKGAQRTANKILSSEVISARKAPVRRKRSKTISVPIPPAPTFGEKMVGLTFNPSGDPNVAEIKRLYAKIIDHCRYELLRVEGKQPQRGAFLQGAIFRAVEAQMLAVKGWTYLD